MKKLLLLLVLLLTGCGDRSDIGNEEIQSPLSSYDARVQAGIIAAALDGHIGRATGTTMSMGQGISHNSFLIFVVDWENTQVGDVIIADYNGKKMIHQVISRTNDAIRTKGTNNASADSSIIWEKDYMGTMIGQIYYRKVLTN